MGDLFEPVSRDARQDISIDCWIKAHGKATIEACTGFGKTYIGLKLLKRMIEKKPDLKGLIVVPTDVLKTQWEQSLDSWGFGLNCQVVVINTVIKNKYCVDFLCLDEVHRYMADTFRQVFDAVEYKLVLGLTATIERLDGKHELLKKYCPVVDTVTLLEAMANGWVAPYKEYQVLISVDDIDIYKEYNKEFTKHFEFFEFDFNLAMSMVGTNGYKAKLAYRDKLCPYGNKEEKSQMLKNINYHAQGFMRAIQNRKTFINNHPKKLELARKIIEARPMSQIITFSNNIKMAESIGIGMVYSGKDSKKKGRATIEEVNAGNIQVLNTIQKCNEGLSLNNLSVAIMLGIDSSKIKAVQRVGRILRLSDDKQAEVFNLIIDGTVEVEWFRKSHNNTQYTTIDEEGLDAVLNYEDPKPYKKKVQRFQFRF